MNQPIPLIGDYTVHEVDNDTFEATFNALRSVVFPDFVFPDMEPSSEEATAARDRLRDRMGDDRIRLRLMVKCGDEIVAWSVGLQRSTEEFHMSNSGVLPEHRRRGVYSALMKHVLDRAQQEGFQTVTSHHHPTNNPVLIAKLRVGFVISGMKIDDRFGLLVNLTYFFDSERRAAFAKKVGRTSATDDF